MESVLQLLKELEERKFYGSVEIKIEAGHVVIIRKTETLKPTYRDTRSEARAKSGA